jgi:hypothetical protein
LLGDLETGGEVHHFEIDRASVTVEGESFSFDLVNKDRTGRVTVSGTLDGLYEGSDRTVDEATIEVFASRIQDICRSHFSLEQTAEG